MNHALYDSSKLIPLAERDKELEELWEELKDVAFDEDEDGRLVLVERWLHFPAGTWNEEIWRWMDERHSKGVAYLMYFTDGTDRTRETAMLMYYKSLCDDCESQCCAYNAAGECRYPMVHHRAPTITEEDGCLSSRVYPWAEEDGR